MNRLYVAAVIILLSILSIGLYRSSVVAKTENGITQKALQGAQEASEKSLKVDVSIQKEKAVALSAVRPSYTSVRKVYEKNPDAVAVDPSWVSVFNSAVRSSNEAVESTSYLSGTM